MPSFLLVGVADLRAHPRLHQIARGLISRLVATSTTIPVRAAIPLVTVLPTAVLLTAVRVTAADVMEVVNE